MSCRIDSSMEGGGVARHDSNLEVDSDSDDDSPRNGAVTHPQWRWESRLWAVGHSPGYRVDRHPKNKGWRK